MSNLPFASKCILALIRVYQRLLSPLLPPSCRFHPTCSQYALESVKRHGALKGGWLTTQRICRCHPFHPGGLDPVPPLEQPHNVSSGSE